MAARKRPAGKVQVIGSAAPQVPAPSEFITQDRVVMSLRQRFNPIRILTPELLSIQLDQMTRGYLWPIMRTWDAMEKRDDRLSAVCPKRYSAVSRYGIEIVSKVKSAAAEAQKEAIEFFFNNCRTQNALDENERGGVRSLLSQMARAVGIRYVCHEILWEPRMNGLTATFRLAPPWYFESITGRLRFLEQDFVYYGVDMPEDRWLVTVGSGIMEASSVVYMFKWMPLKDWVNYTEKYGMPGLLGECNGAFKSPEWNAMVDMLRNFGQDWAAVMSVGSKITPVNPAVSGEVPFKPLIDQCDRAMTILWRGSDLGTMSHHGSGEGQGASLQQSETDLITEDDALWLAETLNTQIVPRVLQYTFGSDEALVELRVMTAEKRDKNQDLAAIQVLGPAGVPFGKSAMLERFDFPQPDEDDELLVFPSNSEPAPPTPDDSETANEGSAAAIRNLELTIANALSNGGNPNHDNAGRFAAAPDRVPVEEADKLLSEGFVETNPEGTEVKFGQRAKDYLETKKDGPQRKSFIRWARETVKSETPVELGDRDVYQKTFAQEGKAKGFTVLVSVKEGEVWDWYRKPASKGGAK